MKKTIAVLPGDGIGPEIISQAVKVLDAVAERYSHEFIYRYADIGAAAIDSCGEPYPDTTHRICMESDAILFGAIGDPRYDSDPSAKVRPEQGLLKMRKSLGLYANIRPVRPYASLLDASPLKNDIVEGSDFVVVRELTGGIYFGEPRGRSEAGDRAFDTCVYSAGEIRRVAETAFGYARRRRGRVTLVDKANVLATSRLWREVVTAMQKTSFPDIALDCLYVDNAAMKMVSDPKSFDVILTENMFGDILSDEASMVTGSIGMLASASLNETKFGLYEPSGGSAPDIAGKGIANPIATILSAAMMLRYSFDLDREAEAVERAVARVLKEGYRTIDIMSEGKIQIGTKEMGDRICSFIE